MPAIAVNARGKVGRFAKVNLSVSELSCFIQHWFPVTRADLPCAGRLNKRGLKLTSPVNVKSPALYRPLPQRDRPGLAGYVVRAEAATRDG